jgi:autophagy-related protein 2
MTSEDLFVAETISSAHPVKLLGEWFNETEHPRDTRCGLVLVKIVTWNPEERVTTENTLENDESEVVMNFLPLRCYIDQKCLRFARAFFTNDREQPDKAWAAHLTEIPPPKFSSFRVRTCKLKVNYTPEKVDVEALRDGSIVELVNLSPLNDMVITLQTVELHEQLGFGEAFSNLARSWIQDICSTQLHKFVTNSAPFQPFSSISTGAVDLVVLPWDAIQNKDSVSRALRTGVKSFAGHLMYETLNVSARLTSFAAAQLSCLISSSAQAASTHSSLPSRPPSLPRNVSETTGHAFESIAKGFETANYKVVIIPYREYRRSGPTGAVKSVVKGIPVAILAPLGAASEALSYALLGARNQLRPDIRKEEEASLKGLSRYSD